MNLRVGLVLTALAIAALGPIAPARSQDFAAQAIPGRQVTMFGIHATPGGGKIDAKLEKIGPQLRKLFPGQNYSFKLLATESKRLGVNETVVCKLGGGWVAGATLVSPSDGDGNILLKFALELNEQTEFGTIVKTPPAQLFFCDKALPDGSKLLIGLGGR